MSLFELIEYIPYAIVDSIIFVIIWTLLVIALRFITKKQRSKEDELKEVHQKLDLLIKSISESSPPTLASESEKLISYKK